MNVINEMYVLPYEDCFIIYAPLLRLVLKVNEEVVALLQLVNSNKTLPNDDYTKRILLRLENLGIINSLDQIPDDIKSSSAEYKPTSLTLLPTSDCNLKCIYCYANAGITSKYLKWQIAKCAIDNIFSNALEKSGSKVRISFLGGGEPFLAWELMKKVIKYSREKEKLTGIQVIISGVTNGLLTKRQINWTIANFQHLSISFDGTKDIQNYHRPTRNSKMSFGVIENSIKDFVKSELQLTIRSTISSYSVDLMPSILEYFGSLGIKRVHFEPLFACGRCSTSPELMPDTKTFTDRFIECLSIASNLNIELLCSAIRIETLSSVFCGAVGENFYVTPEGFVTSCTEVSMSEDPMSKVFFIGQYNSETNKFDIWNDVRIPLTARSIYNMPKCSLCLAKWHCSGGCPVKAMRLGDAYDGTKLDHCKIARGLMEYYLKEISNGNTEFNYFHANSILG